MRAFRIRRWNGWLWGRKALPSPYARSRFMPPMTEEERAELLAQDMPECIKHPMLCPICHQPLPTFSHYCRECSRIVCPDCYLVEEGKCRECCEEATG